MLCDCTLFTSNHLITRDPSHELIDPGTMPSSAAALGTTLFNKEDYGWPLSQYLIDAH